MRPTLFGFRTRLPRDHLQRGSQRHLHTPHQSDPNLGSSIFGDNVVILTFDKNSLPWRNQRRNEGVHRRACPVPAMQHPPRTRPKAAPSEPPTRSRLEDLNAPHGRLQQKPAWRAGTPRFSREEDQHHHLNRLVPCDVRPIAVPASPPVSRAPPRRSPHSQDHRLRTSSRVCLIAQGMVLVKEKARKVDQSRVVRDRGGRAWKGVWRPHLEGLRPSLARDRFLHPDRKGRMITTHSWDRP